MRRLGVWGLGMVLLLGGSGLVRAGDDDSDTATRPPARGTTTSTWFSQWFGGATPPPPKAHDKPAPKPRPKPAPSKAATVVEEAAAVRAREEAALLRRLEVCDKLRQIAEQTSNTELEKLAAELDARAVDVYHQRTSHLPDEHAQTDSERLLLDKHGPTQEASAEEVPAKKPHRDAKQED